MCFQSQHEEGEHNPMDVHKYEIIISKLCLSLFEN